MLEELALFLDCDLLLSQFLKTRIVAEREVFELGLKRVYLLEQLCDVRVSLQDLALLSGCLIRELLDLLQLILVLFFEEGLKLI